MGKNINGRVKYRLVVTKEENNKPSREIPWEGKDVNDSELRKKYCFWLNKLNLYKGNGVNYSRLEKDVKVTSVDVQVSNHKNESGNRTWNDYDDYFDIAHQTLRYNSSM